MVNKTLFKCARVMAGKTNKDVADLLGVKESTIFYKLNVSGFAMEEATKISDYLHIENMMEVFFPDYADRAASDATGKLAEGEVADGE
ncbi:MAG: hypothetical protein LUD47_03225 [Clostridia bacterium]|nr:hypothetical protein [Clostridia bacterium]